ncbi:hypothetical protein QR680_015573 [Steinernema hermaphroditum]|uniref:Uncharacterized protein n=1 Tax=Steinernema hermaphroditum TaxID=289476 RepID=A0AA39HA56_9BILA|nr:hypothetical protein QR680_015573 [Steinernema hermaphroditum]
MHVHFHVPVIPNAENVHLTFLVALFFGLILVAIMIGFCFRLPAILRQGLSSKKKKVNLEDQSQLHALITNSPSFPKEEPVQL